MTFQSVHNVACNCKVSIQSFCSSSIKDRKWKIVVLPSSPRISHQNLRIKLIVLLVLVFQSLRFCKCPLPGLEVFNVPGHKVVLVLLYIYIHIQDTVLHIQTNCALYIYAVFIAPSVLFVVSMSVCDIFFSKLVNEFS